MSWNIASDVKPESDDDYLVFGYFIDNGKKIKTVMSFKNGEWVIDLYRFIPTHWSYLPDDPEV